MAPTFGLSSHVAGEWAQRSRADKRRFRKARDEMLVDLHEGKGFRPGLRIKGVEGMDGVFEMTWAPDGRATFAFGPEVTPGETHIIWRRIGTHDVFRRP